MTLRPENHSPLVHSIAVHSGGVRPGGGTTHPALSGGGRGGVHGFMNGRLATAIRQHRKEISIQFICIETNHNFH